MFSSSEKLPGKYDYFTTTLRIYLLDVYILRYQFMKMKTELMGGIILWWKEPPKGY